MTGEPAQYIIGKTIQEQMMQILKMLRDQADAIQEQIDDLQRQIDDIGAQTIAPIVDGTTPAMRAIQDESGNNIEQTYATLDSLTDGSVTKVGTANVGTDTKPIKLVGGVPTAVTNDLVDVSSAQSIIGEKTFSANMFLGKTAGTVRDIRCVENSIRTGMIRFDTSAGENDVSIYTFAPGSDSLGSTVSAILHKTATDGWLTTSYRPYNSANVNDVVTIGSLAANPNVVHTIGNETINGSKLFVSGVYTGSFTYVHEYDGGDNKTAIVQSFNGSNSVQLLTRLYNDGTAKLELMKTINGVTTTTTVATL